MHAYYFFLLIRFMISYAQAEQSMHYMDLYDRKVVITTTFAPRFTKAATRRHTHAVTKAILSRTEDKSKSY